MSNRAEVSELHFAAEADGSIAIRMTLLGNTTTLHMRRKIAAVALGELIVTMTPPETVPPALNPQPSTLNPSAR